MIDYRAVSNEYNKNPISLDYNELADEFLQNPLMFIEGGTMPTTRRTRLGERSGTRNRFIP